MVLIDFFGPGGGWLLLRMLRPPFAAFYELNFVFAYFGDLYEVYDVSFIDNFTINYDRSLLLSTHDSNYDSPLTAVCSLIGVVFSLSNSNKLPSLQSGRPEPRGRIVFLFYSSQSSCFLTNPVFAGQAGHIKSGDAFFFAWLH